MGKGMIPVCILTISRLIKLSGERLERLREKGRMVRRYFISRLLLYRRNLMGKTKKESTLVFLGKKDEVYTTSEIIAGFAGIQHHTVTRLIQQYENDLKEFGSLRFEIEVRKREVGATTAKTYHLNEEQATLLMTYLKNTAQVRAFKKELVRQFYAMREILWKRQHERQTPAWQTARIEGKKARRLETDAIKLFVEYAKANGSKNAENYYQNFTKLANQVVGVSPGIRDTGSAAQLLDLLVVEKVIDRAVLHEMAMGTEYHTAFQNVKSKVLQVAALALTTNIELSA